MGMKRSIWEAELYLKPWPDGPGLPARPPAQPTHVLIHQLLALRGQAAPVGHGHVGHRIIQEGCLGRGGGCRIAKAAGSSLGPIAPALGRTRVIKKLVRVSHAWLGHRDPPLRGCRERGVGASLILHVRSLRLCHSGALVLMSDGLTSQV